MKSPIMESNNNATANLYNLRKRPRVNLEFRNITFTVPQSIKESLEILRSISGQFRSGQLTAIMGPSGAGKTTLLNALAGYKTIGMDGSVLINGQPMNLLKFRKLSRYIMQNDLLQPLLTVHESMMFAADFKLGRDVSKEDKLTEITGILEMLRLTGTKDTLTEKLSGGERKRVSIALELVNNPPVIFLDEPTTGLDDLSSSQCISLLKSLAEGGRTVICSIHTPSAKIFKRFDNVYILSKGLCVYQGSTEKMMTFMSNLDLTCPTHYNPADFVIEVSSGEYGSEWVERMSKVIENGQNYAFFKDTKPEIESMEFDEEEKDLYHSSSNSFVKQTDVLIRRCCVQTYRNKRYFFLKVALYFIIGLLLGNFYIHMGPDGSKTIFNLGVCYTCMLTNMYFPMLPVLLNFPTEIQHIKREHFNKWYGLPAYYMATTLLTLFFQVFFTLLQISITYTMSEQPMEWNRFLLFTFFCWVVAMVTDSLGMAISSFFSLTNGMFIGPVIAVPLLLLSIHGAGYGSSIPVYIEAIRYLTYTRYAMEVLVTTIYGFGRLPLDCPDEEVLCYLRDPKVILDFMRMENVNIWLNLLALIFWFFFFRLISFFILKQRLQPNKFIVYLQVLARLVKSRLGLAQ